MVLQVGYALIDSEVVNQARRGKCSAAPISFCVVSEFGRKQGFGMVVIRRRDDGIKFLDLSVDLQTSYLVFIDDDMFHLRVEMEGRPERFGYLLHSKYQLIKSTHGVFGSEHVSSIVHQAVQRRNVSGSCTQKYHGKRDQGAEFGVGEISGNVGSKVGKQVEP